ncbi:MAG: DUF3108 domain-containing protein [Burkholderiales bacterium]|nr:DUF3108 domain-containing protein [Burkholderiales bacterium]
MNRLAKTLLFALAISLLVHLLLFFFPDVPSEFTLKEEPLRMELVPPPKPVKFKPIAPPGPKRAPAPSRTEKTASPLAASEPAPEPMSRSSPAPVAASEPQAAPSRVPLHAKLTFRVFRGQDIMVGTAVHTWDIQDDGHYEITNQVEATGIFSLFVKGAIEQVSEGQVTGEGLRPDRYTVTRGGPENRQTARFDWKEGKLTLDSGSSEKTVALEPGTQDQLSFLYQFAYTPPKEGVFTFIATDARKIDTYEYRILGEETLRTGTQKYRTLHLAKLHDTGVEGTEIWLDMDHYYWPVQVMMSDSKGNVLRQMIDKIEIR